MKSFLFVSFAVLAMTGCASTIPASRMAQADTTLPPPDKCEHRPCRDSFDTAGDMVANGGRFVYDTTKKAAVWLSSDETQQRLHDAWATAKTTAQHAYEVAEDAYEAHK